MKREVCSVSDSQSKTDIQLVLCVMVYTIKVSEVGFCGFFYLFFVFKEINENYLYYR